MKIKLIISLLFSFLFVITLFSQENEADNWSQWRGPLGTGVALKGNPPVEFNETKNLKWKTEIPGKGHATPLVWADKIIIQTAVASDEKIKVETNTEASEGQRRMSGNTTDAIHDFNVILVNRENGKIIWKTTVAREHPQESTHNLGSWASNSPCTDGEFIYAYFGSRGVFCLDFDGKILWQKDFGQMEKVMSFGEGSSPYLYKDRLFIQWDHQGESFLIALNKKTGEEDWKVARDEGTSWATPIVGEVNGKAQVITAATSQVRSYDYETGEIIWTCTGLTRNVIPSPVYENGMLFVMSGFRGNALLAIDLSKAKDDITGSDAIVWTYDQDTPYTPQSVLMKDKLYFLRANNGYLSCLNAKDGKVFYAKQKLEGINSIYSSPTGIADRLYIASENICLVVKAGETFEVLSSNVLEDNFHASPVIVGDELILRGFKSLYCFEEK